MPTRLGTGRLTRRRLVLGSAAALGATAAGLALWTGAGQLPGRVRAEPPLIGWLAPMNAEVDFGRGAFLGGLRDQGFVDGENVRVEARWAEGQPDRLPALVAELLALNVRVLVTAGNTPTIAARRATDRVPIVSVNGAEPVSLGFAASLARPGGNLTGVTGSVGALLYAKAAELLIEAVPGARRLAYLGNVANSGSPHEDIAAVVTQRGLELLVVNVAEPASVEPAFIQARDWRADLLVAQNVIPLNAPRELLPRLALRSRIAASSAAVEWVQAGFLLAHDYDRLAVARRGAWYVARILEGAYPGDLPFERLTSFVVAVNRTTLAHLGLTLPEHVALQVTRWES